MIKKYLILFCLILIVSGCATYAAGPLFREAPVSNDGKSMLYVFQIKSPLVYAPIVKINNKPFVRLTKMGYSYAYLFPGVYKLTFDYGGLEGVFISEVEIHAGRETYVEYYGGGFEKRLRELSKAQAIDELKDFRYIEPLNTEF